MPGAIAEDARTERRSWDPARRGCSSMVEPQPSKLMTWVRLPSPAPMGGLEGSRTIDHRFRVVLPLPGLTEDGIHPPI